MIQSQERIQMELKKATQKQICAAIFIQKNLKGIMVRRKYRKLLKRYKKKTYIAMELVESEQTYCENLKYVINQVLEPSKKLIHDKEMHELLFSNIEQIYKLHKDFLEELQPVMKKFNPHLTKLSAVLLNGLFSKDQFKDAYTNYCFNFKTTDHAIKVLVSSNNPFNQHLKKIGLVSFNLSLESYMIKPVQRLCKYGLIVNEYLRNMEKDHIDYQDIEGTSTVIDKLVHETNDQVEEYLMRERFNELKSTFPTFFGKIHSKQQPRMYYETKGILMLDIIREEEIPFRSMGLFENSCVMIPLKISDDPSFTNFIFGREISNSKYFKNLVQLIDSGNYSYIQFKDEKDKTEFMRVLSIKLKQKQQQQYKDYIKVSILGTETRESFFSSYTVYIVNIDDNGKTSTIYPRFKDLLKVQDLMIYKGMKFQPLLLSKESIISTLKSKTIEKRKLTIQQFLERVFNNCQIHEIKQIEDILGVSQLSSAVMMQRMSAEVQQVWVYLPNLQKVKVGITIDSKIKDLKGLISQRMGMQSSNQFQIFQIRNKNYNSKKLLYDGEPVKKIIDQQKDSQTSINPFRDVIDYLYTRHFYLQKNEEEQLYKCDLARAELQLSVIHYDILNYRLQEQVMLTFMCLFAIYIHLPVDNSEKLLFFIKEITKKNYKVTEEEFRIYFSQVRKVLTEEDNIGQSLPQIIIKIISNSYLYQCLQFQVEVHHKIYSSFKKMFSTLEENIFLGLHPDIVYLLSSKDRSVTAKFTYSQLSLVETRPNSIVLELLHSPTSLILKSQLAFEISKIFTIYKSKH